MTSQQPEQQSLLGRTLSRRNVLGGAAGAAVLAAAYKAFGEELLSSSNGSDAAGTPSKGGSSATRAIESEDVKLTHLLRRTGFGSTRDDYERYRSMGLDATIDELVHFDAVDDSEAEQMAAALPVDQNPGIAVVWWLTRMANTKRPLQEKMALFWHGLLTSQTSVVKDPQAMIRQNNFFRDNALAAFPDILKGISHDPAMMLYLDIAGSRAQAPNENYARELMELFSMGEGNYTEEDVREAARAFTGWTVPRQRQANGRPQVLDPVFVRRAFDAGPKTFLGRTGNFGAEDIIDIIAEQAASARYIVNRLFTFFVHPDPFDSDLQPFIDVYMKNGKSIGAVVEAMLRSDAFYSPAAYRSLVKSPIEYAVGVVKALGMEANLAGVLGRNGAGGGGRDGGVFGQMGQIPFEPPNVAGWPGGASWLNSGTIFARLNLVNTLLSTSGAGAGAQRRQAAAGPEIPQFATPSDLLDHYLPFVLDDNIPDEARSALHEYAGGPAAELTPDMARDLVYLVLGMPQFHLA